MRICRQRADWDCAVGALATLTGETYEAVHDAMMTVAPTCRGQGFYNREVVAVAAELDVTLRPMRRYDLDTTSGILRVYWHRRDARAKASPFGHMVAALNGWIVDPSDGTATPWRQFQAEHGVRFCTLLAQD